MASIDGHCRTMADLLARIERHRQVSHGKPALQDVVSRHFAPESRWYQAFQAQYCAGRVSPDGRVLARNVLPIDPHPAIRAADAEEKSLVEPQTFELVSEQSRTLIGRTSRNVQTRLNQVYAALGGFFVDHCPSIKELLHPWMN